MRRYWCDLCEKNSQMIDETPAGLTKEWEPRTLISLRCGHTVEMIEKTLTLMPPRQDSVTLETVKKDKP